jgi:hypothetical protein
VNATAEDRADARAVMLDRAAMTALVEAARSGTNLEAHEHMRVILAEYNAGHGCVDIRNGRIVYAKSMSRGR